MIMPKVALVDYETPGQSVTQAVEMCGGLPPQVRGGRVFIKPNIVFWSKAAPFPKFGVVTTSRVVEDMVILLREAGAREIIIGEGTVVLDPKDKETQEHAFASLGYHKLAQRHGVQVVSVFQRPFEKRDLGDGFELSFNRDVLHSDLVVDLPVLKTHAQTVVSLGIKNLKGTIDIPSRKRCHNNTPGRDLHHYVARLAQPMPPIFTLIDGIYSNERGPAFDGRMRRLNLLIASRDVLFADLVGSRVLGWDPAQVPHLAIAAGLAGRPTDLSDVELIGRPLEEVASFHDYTFPYNEAGNLPLPMVKKGISGVSYPKYDLSLCTYCSGLTGVILTAIAFAWQGQPWDQVEVLTGKDHKPTPGMNKTILVGKCIYQANKDHPDIKEMLAIKGCPPQPGQIAEALMEAGIPVNRQIFDNLEMAPAFFLSRYQGKPEFDEKLFQVD